MLRNYTNRIIVPDTHYLRCQIPHCHNHADLYCEPGRHDGLATDVPAIVQYALCPDHAVKYGFCRNCGKYVGTFALRSVYPRFNGLCQDCCNLMNNYET